MKKFVYAFVFLFGCSGNSDNNLIVATSVPSDDGGTDAITAPNIDAGITLEDAGMSDSSDTTDSFVNEKCASVPYGQYMSFAVVVKSTCGNVGATSEELVMLDSTIEGANSATKVFKVGPNNCSSFKSYENENDGGVYKYEVYFQCEQIDCTVFHRRLYIDTPECVKTILITYHKL